MRFALWIVSFLDVFLLPIVGGVNCETATLDSSRCLGTHKNSNSHLGPLEMNKEVESHSFQDLIFKIWVMGRSVQEKNNHQQKCLSLKGFYINI